MPVKSDIKIQPLFYPLSYLYGLGVKLRNKLFDWGCLRAKSYSIPVICIGNLAVGGTGKTPHTEYIIRLLKDKYRIAVLSRGYKRKTSGFLLANEHSTSNEIGDEPYQMKRKFPDILIAVDANRCAGIEQLLALPEGKRPEVILLDDAFQHRYVSPSLSIVLTDFHRLFCFDKLLPVGRLREPIIGIRRANMVIVTKCDGDMMPIDYRIIQEKINLSAHQSIHFTRILYADFLPVFSNQAPSLSKNNIDKENELLVITGIASPESFIKEIHQLSNNVSTLTFPDHHAFMKSDIAAIHNVFEKMNPAKRYILTTEKDAVRFMDNPHIPETWKSRMYYLPITVDFCTDSRFDEAITNHITTFYETHS